MEADPRAHALRWLKGLGAEVTKAQTAKGEAERYTKDDKLSELYVAKFEKHLAFLTGARGTVELMQKDPNQAISAEEVDTMAKALKDFREDSRMWATLQRAAKK